MGPTPPGTGVMKAARLAASAVSTSPSRRWPDFLVSSEVRREREVRGGHGQGEGTKGEGEGQRRGEC